MKFFSTFAFLFSFLFSVQAVVLTPISADPFSTETDDGNKVFRISGTNTFSTVMLHLESDTPCPTGCTQPDLDELLEYTVLSSANVVISSGTATWDSNVGSAGGFIINISNSNFLGGTDVEATMVFSIPSCFGNEATTEYSLLFNPTQPLLPVELTSFTARVVEKEVKLHWETASEINNSHFEVEWSSDGVRYQTVGEVAGAGTTAEEQRYSFEHDAPVEGNNFYRLKQVDFDGTETLSEVEVVQYTLDDRPNYWRVLSSDWRVIAEGDTKNEIPQDRGLWILFFESEYSRNVIRKEMIILP